MRALSLCTCCRQYPGAAKWVQSSLTLTHFVSAFPTMAGGSACTSSFSRLARRSLALRPAHAHGHQVATAIQRLQTFRHLHACSGCFRLEHLAGWDLHPLESAALSRRTPFADLHCVSPNLPFALQPDTTLSGSSFAPGRIHAHDPKLPSINADSFRISHSGWPRPQAGFEVSRPNGRHTIIVRGAWYPTASANSATARLRASLNARGPALPQVLLEHQI